MASFVGWWMQKGLKLEVIHRDYSGIIRGMQQIIMDV